MPRKRVPQLPAALEPVLTPGEIEARIAALSAQVLKKIKARERPVAVVVLQGGFFFASDLLRKFPAHLDLEIAFLRCQSYGKETRSSGKVVLLQDLDPEIELRGRTVLLIDDILDTGRTLKFLVEHLYARGAKRVHTVLLLRKRGVARVRGVRSNFTGFDVPPKFYVGFGMDWAGRYRELPGLAAVRPEALRAAKKAARA